MVLSVCLGYVVRNVETWCGMENSKDLGMDSDECTDRTWCQRGKTVPTDAFWKALSAHVRTNHSASSTSVSSKLLLISQGCRWCR